jgi:hypothetical protein
VEALGRGVQPRGSDGHDRPGPAADSQFQRDAGTDRVAQDVHLPDSELVEIGQHGRGDRRDGGPDRQRRGAAVPGQVRCEHLVFGIEPRPHCAEVVVCAADAVQEEQRLAFAGAIPGELQSH